MKRSTKTWLIAALCLVVAGIVVSVIGLAVLGFDFTKLGTRNMETNTHFPEAEFTQIRVETYTSNIHIVPSEDSGCRVVCYEDAKMKHTVQVKDGVLEIRQTDDKEWYEYIGINLSGEVVTVHLPESSYEALRIETATGNVETAKAITFQSAEIKTNTGNVEWQSPVSGKLSLDTDTGNVDVYDVSCESLEVKTATGNICLENTVAADTVELRSATGNVTFRGADAAEITVETETGDVKGSLLSEKIFVAKTETGRLRVPETVSGGKCHIETETGDIEITIQ